MFNLLTSVHNFFNGKKIKLPPEWVEACVQWLQEEHSDEPQNVSKANWVCQKAYEQWLFADLAELAHGCLPNYLNDRKCTLQEDLVLQINSIQDVGLPSYAQLQQLRKDDIQNSLIDSDKVKPQMWEPKPNRMLLITLTDGVTTVLGMEYTALSCLSLQTQPGTKIMVKRGCQARQGVLLLTSAVVAVLGGAVDTLLVANAVENVVRRQLGLEEVETPSTYEEPVATPSVPSSQTSQYCPGTQSQRPANAGNVTSANQSIDRWISRSNNDLSHQSSGGCSNQTHGGTKSKLGNGPGAKSSGPVRQSTNAASALPNKVQPNARGGSAAYANLEHELDDDFDLDLEAAMLEAEYAHSNTEGSTASQSIGHSAMKDSLSKSQVATTNNSCNSVKSATFSRCGPSLTSQSSKSSIETSSTATSISLDNRIPNSSRPRPKLSYNPFLEPGPNNVPPVPVNECNEDFDDGLSEQDLSALEEELQLVESKVYQGSYEAHQNISGRQPAPQTSLANQAGLSDSLASKNIHGRGTGDRKSSKSFNVSVAPQKKTLFKSVQGDLSSKDEDSSIKLKNDALCPMPSKLIDNDNRASIKRPPASVLNAHNESPLSNKLRKLNTMKSPMLYSPNDSKSCVKDELRNESPKVFKADTSPVKSLAVVYPQENGIFKSKDASNLENFTRTQEKRSLSETAKLGHPITYLIFLPRCPLVEQDFIVKGFVMTLLSRLEHRQGKWQLAVCINDGSAGLDVDVHDQVLQELVGLSVPEMRALRASSNNDTAFRAALTEKVGRCREQLISLCSLFTVRVAPELQRPLLVHIAPFTQAHAKQLQQRCQLCIL